MSLFDSIDNAFAPFFDELVCVEGVRGAASFAVPCKACVMDKGFVDADADAVAESGETGYSVRVLRRVWSEAFAPRRGDTVRFENGTILKVVDCSVDGTWYDLSCKTKGGAK